MIILVALILVWFAIWSGLECDKYIWHYSDSTVVAAYQYLFTGLWWLSVSICPAWIMGGTVLAARILKVKF